MDHHHRPSPLDHHLTLALLPQESVSTCRFAQRCGMLSHTVTANEGKDLNALAASLRKDVRDLKKRLAAARQGVLGGGVCVSYGPVRKLTMRLPHRICVQ